MINQESYQNYNFEEEKTRKKRKYKNVDKNHLFTNKEDEN